MGAVVFMIIVGFIITYRWNQCISPQTMRVWIPLRRGVLGTTLYDKVCQWFVAVRWFSPGTLVSSKNKTDHHDITKILLKVALNTITPLPPPIKLCNHTCEWIIVVWSQVSNFSSISWEEVTFEWDDDDDECFLSNQLSWYFCSS